MTLLRCLPLIMMVSVAAASGSARVDVTAEYASNWDDVRLEQDGNQVFGSYVCCGGGKIEGRIINRGSEIRYHWEALDGSSGGMGRWTIDGDRLEGTWGSGQDDHDGGRWDLVKKSSLAN